MLLAAARYLSSMAGDITSASLTLVNPSPAAPSAGNSRAGRRSTPVRSRIVLLYSVLLSRRSGTNPGSPVGARPSCTGAIAALADRAAGRLVGDVARPDCLGRNGTA